jgi:hypothetical protein
MDPYLEAHWRDVHARLVIYASDALQAVLPRPLRARVEERVLLETPMGLGDHPLFSDVRIVQYQPEVKRGVESSAESRVAVAAPLLVEADVESASETFLEIIDPASGNRAVTIIEFLSPSNKSPGANREQYLRKQREVCRSDANLVEIDLNRFGTHSLAFPLGRIAPRGRTAYMVCVRRATQRGMAEVYPLPLREQLPVINIPLRASDADAPLDLQPLVERCYANGAYEGTLDYAADPDPPLSGADKKWAEAELRKQRLRPRKRPTRSKGRPKSR